MAHPLLTGALPPASAITLHALCGKPGDVRSRVAGWDNIPKRLRAHKKEMHTHNTYIVLCFCTCTHAYEKLA